MAFLFIKSMISPRVNSRSYTLLPTISSHDNDDSRAPSTDSTFSQQQQQHVEDISEKTATTTAAAQAFPTCAQQLSSARRIDPRLISDATIGLSDGLTVPFALTAGLSALGDTRVVIYGGLAELIAGGISMGLGGYLGAKGEAQAYEAAQTEIRKMIVLDRGHACRLVRATFSSYHFSDELLDGFVAELAGSDRDLEDFLMRFHHQLPESTCTTSRAYISALVIAAGYFFGGLMPLLPYFVASTIHTGFSWSVAIMAVALFAFGYVKTMLVGEGKRIICLKGGVQMMILGGVAAAAAMGCVKAIGG